MKIAKINNSITSQSFKGLETYYKNPNPENFQNLTEDEKWEYVRAKLEKIDKRVAHMGKAVTNNQQTLRDQNNFLNGVIMSSPSILKPAEYRQLNSAKNDFRISLIG